MNENSRTQWQFYKVEFWIFIFAMEKKKKEDIP